MAIRKRPDARLPLTRERVLRGGIALADRAGLESLTMRALGEALGVQAMSLYNHVKGKEDILDGMVDLVVAEIEVPSRSEPWRLAMRKRALSAHAVLLRHAWACGLLMSRVNVGPSTLRYVDATIGCLNGAGFPLPLADHVWNALDSYIYGFTLHKLNFPFEAQEYARMAAGYLPHLSSQQYPAMHALTTLVAAGRHDGLHDLDFGLELLFDGFERLLDIKAAPNR